MQIGISQLICPKMSMEEFFQQASAAGYEVVELAMGREGELTPQSGEKEFNHIVALSEEYRLPTVSMVHYHCTGNLLAGGHLGRTAIEETKVGLKAAAAMGIRCTLHTLGRLNPDLYYDDAYRNGVQALKEIAQTAEQLDVSLAVEFVWNGFLFSPLEMKHFLEEIASTHVGFYMDPGNMAVFQYPQHWIRILARHIKMVHLKDWKGAALRGGWTALLEGEVDYPAVKRELLAAGYHGPLISEVDTTLASLEQTAQAIGKIIQM